MNKQPEKTAQTKQSLIDAFWVVAEKRGLRSATISETAKVAGLNRGTFYVYFSDMEDLLEQAEQAIIDDFLRHVLGAAGHATVGDYRVLTEYVVSALEKYDDKLFLLIGKDGDPEFLYRMRTIFAGILPKFFPADEELQHLEYIIAYITSSFVGMLQLWYETGKEIPLSDLTALAHTLALQGISGLHGSD